MAKYPVRTPPSRLKRATGNSGLFGGVGYAAVIGGGSTDPFFSSVVFLAGFEGTNGATTTNDESSKAHGAGTFSNSDTISTAQAKFGSSSLSAAAGSCASWPDSSDYALTNQAFTIECWIYAASYSGNQFLVTKWQTSQLSWAFWVSGGKLAWNNSPNGSTNNADITCATTPSINAWHHAAIDFDGTKYRIYLDGVMDGSFSTVRTCATTIALLAIGSDTTGSFALGGFMDEVRITKGVARYANDSGFAVPTSAFPRS